jgi:hypothetical protein
MATLKGLKPKIEAGKIVQRRAQWADGYEAVTKQNGTYVHIHNVDLQTFETFRELYQHAEPDAKAFKESPEYLDTWEPSPEPTEAEKARWQPLIAAFIAGEEETLHALVKDFLVQQMEASLFQSRMSNPRVKKQIMAHIARIREAQ